MQKLRILLVEDSPSSVFLFREALRASDMPSAELLLAESGEDALRIAIAPTELPAADLIVLDLNLPHGSTGFDFLREVRRQDRPIHTPVCVLTSSDRDVDAELAYELGANCYVQKPINMQEYVHTIGNMIRFWAIALRQQGAAEPALAG